MKEKVEELKNLFGVKTDVQLAEKMSVAEKTIRNWKTRGLPNGVKTMLIEKPKPINPYTESDSLKIVSMLNTLGYDVTKYEEIDGGFELKIRKL